MKPANFLQKLLFATLAIVLLAAALPSSVFAQSNLMRFIIENKTSQPVTVRLYSSDGAGRAYYMSVNALETKFMTPERGQYNYWLSVCGVTTRGQLDLSKHQFKWLVPKCGDKGGPGSKAPNTQDVGKLLALTKVTLINETGARLVLTLRGPHTYVFTIPAGGEKDVSIMRGEYTWGHFACNNGEYQRGNLTASAGRVRAIRCK